MDIFVVDQAIDAEEHGKKLIYGYSGTDKTFAEGEFRLNVEYQPDAVEPLRQSVFFHQIEGGQRIDLANIFQQILSRADRLDGSVPKLEPKKPRKNTSKKSTALSKRNSLSGRRASPSGSASEWRQLDFQPERLMR